MVLVMFSNISGSRRCRLSSDINSSLLEALDADTTSVADKANSPALRISCDAIRVERELALTFEDL
jgi:hypothetical protein